MRLSLRISLYRVHLQYYIVLRTILLYSVTSILLYFCILDIYFSRQGVEFAIGALAAVGAGFFTNPVDVVKVRLQLQGELEARGSYKKIYKNTVHAAYLIAKHEGAFALQAGLVPALAFQVVLNGIRLGAYKSAQRYELIVDKQGNTDVLRTVLVSGTAGCFGAVLGSPLYLVIVI